MSNSKRRLAEIDAMLINYQVSLYKQINQIESIMDTFEMEIREKLEELDDAYQCDLEQLENEFHDAQFEKELYDVLSEKD